MPVRVPSHEVVPLTRLDVHAASHGRRRPLHQVHGSRCDGLRNAEHRERRRVRLLRRPPSSPGSWRELGRHSRIDRSPAPCPARRACTRACSGGTSGKPACHLRLLGSRRDRGNRSRSTHTIHRRQRENRRAHLREAGRSSGPAALGLTETHAANGQDERMGAEPLKALKTFSSGCDGRLIVRPDVDFAARRSTMDVETCRRSTPWAQVKFSCRQRSW